MLVYDRKSVEKDYQYNRKVHRRHAARLTERLAAQASYITDYDSRTGAFLTMETASKKSPLGYEERQASIFSYWLPAMKGLDSRRFWR